MEPTLKTPMPDLLNSHLTMVKAPIQPAILVIDLQFGDSKITMDLHQN